MMHSQIPNVTVDNLYPGSVLIQGDYCIPMNLITGKRSLLKFSISKEGFKKAHQLAEQVLIHQKETNHGEILC